MAETDIDVAITMNDDINIELTVPGGGVDVTSVNSMTGTVTLDQDDVGDGTTYKQYSATEKTKLAGIEANADVTDATNVAAAGAYMKLTDSAADVAYDDTVGTIYGVTGDDTQEYTDNLTVAMGDLFGQIIGVDLPAKISYTETSTASMDFVIDEDNMASNSATKVPTQQSTKAYVDTQVGAIPELTEGNGITLTDLGGGITEIAIDLTAFDTDDLAEGSTNLYSQWEHYTNSSMTFLQPSTSTDKLHIGTLTNFSAYSSLSASKAFFTTQADSAFFTQIASGSPAVLNAGAAFLGARSRGTLDAPTSVATGDGLVSVSAVAFGSSNTLATTSSGKTLWAALMVRAGTVGASDVSQDVHLGVGLGGNGVIRYNSDDQIGFFGTTPASKSTGWSVTNVTSDKTFNANATTIDEIADVLGTLIDTLKTHGLLGA